MNVDVSHYRPNCSHFRGDIPCKPHKLYGVHCDGCQYFSSQKGTVLIIKLGAVGDIIRTTPLLRRISLEYTESPIWWLTYTPDVLPDGISVFTPSAFTFETFRSIHFAAVINLDKDLEACAITSQIKADKKFGFTLLDGKPSPCNDLASSKFIRGIFDDVSKANFESYPKEIFDICGWQFSGEEYVMPHFPEVEIPSLNNVQPVVGLNTGCGERWTSRLWAVENWEELIVRIQNAGLTPLLLGGKQEEARNRELQLRTASAFAEPASLQQFFGVMNNCDIVVTGVTMGLHIAVGLRKRVVLMNNIFNPHEFYLYDRGEIVEPQKECHCYYRPSCQHDAYRCMEHLSVASVFEAVLRQTSLIPRK